MLLLCDTYSLKIARSHRKLVGCQSHRRYRYAVAVVAQQGLYLPQAYFPSPFKSRGLFACIGLCHRVISRGKMLVVSLEHL